MNHSVVKIINIIFRFFVFLISCLCLGQVLAGQTAVSRYYDDAGRLVSLVYSDSSITYVYDDLGNILHINVEGDGIFIVVDKLIVDVPEGGTADLSVRLSQAPAGPTNVDVTAIGGDADLSITAGGSLTFDSSDWDQFKTVTFAAAEDADADNGSASFAVQSAGLPDVTVVVREVDNEAPTCSFVLDRTSRSFVVQGGTDDVRVTTDAACGWTAVSNAGWISIDSGASYTGTASVTYTVAENTAPNPRTGTMTVAGETFTVDQAGTSTAYTLSVVRIGTGSGTVTSNPAGIDCGATCGASFAEETNVTLTAAYAAGSHFGGWSGPCSGTGTCALTIQDHTTVTAVFDLDTDFEIISTRPADGDTGVPPDITFGIDFSDSVYEGPDFGLIEVRDAGGTPLALNVYVYPDNAWVLIDPVGLEYATTYTLTIPAGAFQNAQGDPLSSAVSVTFTTLDLGSPRLSIVGHPRWLFEGTQATANVWFDRRSDVNRIVTLSKSGTGNLTFPSQVTVPAGELKVDFTVTATQNTVSDGDRATTLTAEDSTGQQKSFVFDVFDDDTYNSGAIRQTGSWLQNDDDGDGIFEAGEWSEMVVQVRNYGSTYVSPVAIEADVVDTFDLYPRGSPPHCNVYNLQPGVTNTCDFDLISDEELPTGRYHVKVRGTFGSLWFEEYTAVDVVNESLPDFRVSANLQGVTVDPGQLLNLEYVTLQGGDGFDPALPHVVVYFEPTGGAPEVVYETHTVTRGYFETEEVIELQVAAPSTPGDYRAWAEINPDLGARIIESDYTNNLSPDITITVRDPNQPPTIDPIADGSVVAGTVFTTVATASDPDPGDLLTFDLPSAPAGASIDPSTGVFSWPPGAQEAPGTTTVTVRVTDSGSPGRSDSTTFDLTVVQQADLSVSASDGLTQAVPGQWLSYEVMVSNLGPSAITGATVSQTPTVDMLNVSWTCVASPGSQCSASGAALLSDSIDLLPQGSAIYTVSVQVADSASGTLEGQFAAAVPAGATDPQPDNDQAIDVDTLLALDFGDAPDDLSSASTWRYATRLVDDGARHGLTGQLYLGSTVDGEADGQPSLDALGDDATASDEDGVVFLTPLAVCETTELEVTSSASGFLDGWIDWNADGDWADLDERVFEREPLVAGVNALTLAVPCTSTPVSETFARFRLSNVGDLDTTGLAFDGEVEDYRVAVYGLDFGDAADPSFPTLRPNDGARHVLANGLFLGTQVDAEAEGQPDVLAIGDDGTGSPDEDGVVATSLLVPGATATLEVTASAAGLLDAWFDLNGNGTWSDPGEKVVTGAALSSGVNEVSVPIPAETSPGIDTVARFRLSTDGVPAPEGLADDGEVEDHLLSIAGVADLSVSKSDSRTMVAPGEDVTYTIVVSNDGPTAVDGVQVLDPLPAPLSSATWSCTAGPGASCIASGTGGIDDTVVVLPAGGQVVYSLTATLPASATGTVVNTVTVSPPAGIVDPDVSNNVATDEDVMTPRADLAVVKTSSTPDVLPGQGVSFAITVTNLGPSDVTGATVEDLVPEGLAGVTWSCSAPPGANCGSGVGDLVDTIALPVGTALTYSLDGTLMDGVASLANTADVLPPAGVTDPDPGNNSATVEVPLRAIDYGDAPDAVSGPWAYPTRLADDGARHGIVAGFGLGGVVDAELDGQPEVDATGDDATGDPSDEDGVVFLAPVVPGAVTTVSVQAMSAGVLDAFFDWNRDGDWQDPGELVFASLPVPMGISDLGFSVPVGATPGLSFARFRLSSTGGLSSTGLAVDGEVEDHAVLIENAMPTLTVTLTGDGLGTVTSDVPGIDCGTDCSEVYALGDPVTLTATPGAASGFGGWGGDCAGMGPCALQMDGDRSVTANFHLWEYALTVTKTGSGTVTSFDGGIGCGGDCAQVYPYDSTVELVAVPGPGWVFDAWSGDCAGGGVCSLTMDATRSVEAIFVRPQGLAVVESPSPFGYVPLASLGVEPFACPTVACDDTGWLLDGLDFFWWGQHQDSLSWVTNGYVYLDASGSATPANQELPDPVAPNGVLAPFWSDLDLDGGDGVGGGTWYLANLTDGVSTWHVLEWENAQEKDVGGSSYSFQIWIEVGTANIWFAYGALSPEPPALVTVGAEDDSGSEGFLFYYDGLVAAPEDGTELRVVAPGYCAGVTDLELSHQVLGSLALFEACNSITVGPQLDVVFPGDVTLSSTGMVDFKNGFAVRTGAQLRVASGPITGPRSALAVSPVVPVPQAVGVVGME